MFNHLFFSFILYILLSLIIGLFFTLWYFAFKWIWPDMSQGDTAIVGILFTGMTLYFATKLIKSIQEVDDVNLEDEEGNGFTFIPKRNRKSRVKKLRRK